MPEQTANASGLPLTLNDNHVRLGTDPLDFGALRQVVAVGVVAGPALVGARVVEREVGDVDGAGGVLLVSGVDFDPVLPGTIPQLDSSLVGLGPFEPPLDLWDGAADGLTVQFHTVLCQFLLRQRRLCKASYELKRR